ncbi:MAG: shikimate dehydrogenase [Lachnospiraceae bacterium]|nr:shikimate dehydrogenase [Lachnospiraceae bacterium]
MNYQITGNTKLTALLGSPVSHSISPQMHNEAFYQLGLDYVYLAFDVTPETLGDAVKGLKAAGICGFNLTMPLKVHILPLLDELTPAARLAGAVNTVIVKNGRMIGHTTDGTGYMRSVIDAGYNIIGKKMTLLGAGGAATAICVQAALDGVSSIDMFKRKNASWDKTMEFCQQTAFETGCKINLLDFNDTDLLAESISKSAVLTNATSLGMAPDTDISPIPDPAMLRQDLIVSDIIYNPRKTLLIEQAEQQGCPCFNGLYMLLYQGAAAFTCWTGREMPIDVIKQKYFSN